MSGSSYKPLIADLSRRIKESILDSADGREFIPEYILYKVFAQTDVELMVSELGCKDFKRVGLAQSISTHYRKVFAILTSLGREDTIAEFRDRGLRDDSLPFLDEPGLEAILNGSSTLFVNVQWKYIPHFFSANTSSYYHVNITPKDRILPFVKAISNERQGHLGEMKMLWN